MKAGKVVDLDGPEHDRFSCRSRTRSTSSCMPSSMVARAIFSCKRHLASTVGDLAMALRELFASNAELRIIGTRHGEKLYESLLSREEMAGG